MLACEETNIMVISLIVVCVLVFFATKWILSFLKSWRTRKTCLLVKGGASNLEKLLKGSRRGE